MHPIFTLLSLVSLCSAANNCAWFVGRLQCSDPTKLDNVVVEIWDKDRSFFPLTLFVEDDLAGRTITSSEDHGTFKVEGCASDLDFLVIRNEPEFYVKVRHFCKGRSEVTIAHPRNPKIFVPQTNDYFTNHPIVLG